LLFKRSVYVSAEIKAGEIFTAENIKVIRPGLGLHPRYYEQLIGKKANQDYQPGTPLTADALN